MDIPPISGGNAHERVQRASELGAERIRNIELLATIRRLETEVAVMNRNRDRAGLIRFVVLCAVLMLGLAAVVYIQIDSRGSGQLRGALIKQCETRNANVVVTKQGLEQQALNSEQAGDTDDAQVWRTLARTLATVDCATLR